MGVAIRVMLAPIVNGPLPGLIVPLLAGVVWVDSWYVDAVCVVGIEPVLTGGVNVGGVGVSGPHEIVKTDKIKIEHRATNIGFLDILSS